MTRLLLVSIAILCCANAAKILGIFPVPSRSHVLLGSSLLKELTNHGHEVVMLSAFPLRTPVKNYSDIVLEGLADKIETFRKLQVKEDLTLMDMYKRSTMLIDVISRDVLEHENVQNLLKSGEKYDLVIQLWGFGTEALLGIGHRLNATTIGFSVLGTSFMVNYLTRNPAPYSYVPHLFLTTGAHMTFFKRVLNTLANVAGDLLYFGGNKYVTSVYEEFFPDGPPLKHLTENVDIILSNSHFTTESPRPHLPNIIQIGGFYMEETKTLPGDLRSYLDSSKYGVVYFSLGTNIKMSDFSTNTLNEFLGAFKQLKYNILWKSDEQIENIPKNVRIQDWLPQKAILDHPNVKLFITHGGLGSTVESIYYGVPMLCIPVFADQEKNAYDSVTNGYALQLSRTEIFEQRVLHVIKEIIENPKYKENIMRRSELMRNYDVNPMKKALYWVEHAIKYQGAKHLKPKVMQLPWYQYMLLDVIAFLITVIVITIYCIYYSFKKFITILSKRKCKNKKLS